MAIQKRRGKITSKFHNTKYRCDGLVHSLPGIPPSECAHDGTGKLQCPFLTRAHRVPSEACHAGPTFSLTSGIRQPLPTGSQTTAEPRLFHVLPKASDSIGPLCSCRALLLLPAWAIGEPLVKHRPPSLWHFDAGTPQEQQNIQKKCAGTTLWAICGQMRSCAPKAGTCSGCGLFVHRARRRSCTGIFFLQLRAEIEKNEVIHRNGRASIYYHY